MTRALRVATVLAVSAVVAAAAQPAGASPPTPPGSDPAERRFDPATFAAPVGSDRPNAFWFWNGALSEPELERQLELMRAGGVEEFFIHPRQGLGGAFGQSENAYYLSRDYFEKVRFVLDRARALGMHAWLYDDLNWPSGYAGGRVLEGGEVDGRQVQGDPDLIARYLRLGVEEVEGGGRYDEPVPLGGSQGWSVRDGELVTDGGDIGLTRDGAAWRDYRMAFDATIENVAVGWTLRARDPSNLIMVNLTSTSEHNPEAASTFGVHVRENGGYRLVGGRIPAGKPIEPGARYRIATEIEGSTLRLNLDGQEVASVTDPAFATLAAGRVGFRSDGNGGERARVDDLRVTALPGGEELFADDFESGDLSRYEATLGETPELVAALAARPPAGQDCAPGGRLDGDSLVELTGRVEDGRLRWDAPEGRWCLLFLTQHRLTNYHPDLEPENQYVDMLNPAATRRFIDITHETYAHRFGGDFGGLIRGIFNDEPGFYNNFPDGRGGAETRGSIPWTPGFRDYLQDNLGYDVVRELPAVWYDVGERTTAVRVDYYDALQDRYNEAHTKPLSDWAADHRISLISNPLVEESLGDHKLIGGGDWFEMSRHYQIPGMDLIGGLNLDAVTPKLNSSVAHAFDRGRNLAESFGAFGWDLTLEEMKRGIAWEAAGGVDLTDNHAFYYSIEGQRAFESQPSEFFQNLFWPHFGTYADTVGRLNGPARGSTPVNPVGVLYPTTTILAEGTPYSNRGFFGNGPELGPIDQSWQAVSTALLRGQLDFDYVNERQLAGDRDLGAPIRARGGELAVHDNRYRTLVWPRTTTLQLEALDEIERFVRGGGSLVAVEALPVHEAEGRDARLRDRLRALFGTDPGAPQASSRRHGSGRTVFRPTRDGLADAVRGLEEPDTILSPATGDVRVRHVRRGGEHAYLLTNTADRVVRTEADLDRRGVPELWFPETGRTGRAPVFRSDGARTVVPLALEPYESVWIVFRGNDGDVAHVTASNATIESVRAEGAGVAVRAVAQRPGTRYVAAARGQRRYAGEFEVTDPLEPLRLGGDWELRLERDGAQTVRRPLGSWTDLDPRFSGRGRYTRRFAVPPGFLADGRRIQLELGQVDELAEVRLNGRDVGSRVWAPYRLDVTDALREGENTLEVVVSNTQANEIEGRPLSSGLIGPVALRPERVVDVTLERGAEVEGLDASVAPES
ncbi:MAG TPA: glycosyl hydrolase, partial [Solirubrobacteraceae bacterium]|nr:glycosyl hydrolase [Solirubrobacteraceae bacterium]